MRLERLSRERVVGVVSILVVVDWSVRQHLYHRDDFAMIPFQSLL